jgi:hypothetical protein
MKLTRTAGPLGRAFGFSLQLGKLYASFNAGWYVLFLNWQGSWYVHLSPDPWQWQGYRKGGK